jgi:hypothetical protein
MLLGQVIKKVSAEAAVEVPIKLMQSQREQINR